MGSFSQTFGENSKTSLSCHDLDEKSCMPVCSPEIFLFGTSHRFLNCMHGSNCFPSSPTLDGSHQPPSVCGRKKPKLRGPTTPQSSPHTVPQRVNGRLSTYRPFYFLLDLGSMVRINRLFPLFKNGVYWGYNHLLTPYYSYSFIRPSTCE